MRRICRMVFIGLFLLLTLLPGWQMLTHAVPDQAVDEQRSLAPPPNLHRFRTASRQANAWFSDHFGLRSWLIRLKAETDYRIFGTSDRVYVGRDGYLFYRTLLDQERPSMNAYLAANGARVAANIARYAAALHAAGIGMLLDINPLGDSMMPDKLPRMVANRPPLLAIPQFVERLRSDPNLMFIDSTAILRRTMQQRPVYQRTDFHWNEPAAFEVFKAMVDAISRRAGLPHTAWNHTPDIVARPYSGGVARFMPLLTPLAEQSLFLRQNWQWPAGFHIIRNDGPYQITTRTSPDAQGLLPPVFLIGDSYLNPILETGFPAYFRETYRMLWAWGMPISAVTAAIPPDAHTVVVEFIETNQIATSAFGDDDDVDRSIALLRQRRNGAAIERPINARD